MESNFSSYCSLSESMKWVALLLPSKEVLGLNLLSGIEIFKRFLKYACPSCVFLKHDLTKKRKTNENVWKIMSPFFSALHLQSRQILLHFCICGYIYGAGVQFLKTKKKKSLTSK